MALGPRKKPPVSDLYGDGQPVTLRLADAVLEILPAGRVSGTRLPSKRYT
jgi:hypothetical protein